MTSTSKKRVLWAPKPGSITQTDRFRRFVNKRHSLNLLNYDELHAYSIGDETAPSFWVDLFIFLKIKANTTPLTAYKEYVIKKLYPPPKFFPGIKLNFAENLLADRPRNKVALYVCQEAGINLQEYTWGYIYSYVERVADALVACGVQRGDRVAAVISNRLETIVICLAALSIGGIWSTSSLDMGEAGILDRLLQIKPKLVFTENSVVYNGKKRDMATKTLNCAQAMLSSEGFQNYVVIPNTAEEVIKEDTKRKVITLEMFLDRGVGRKLTFVPLPFCHPGFIFYSSGTTGPPKCIVHSAAGLLLSVKKDSVISMDVTPEDTILQYSTTGWIMWAMTLCGLSYGGRTVIYDGSPLVPDKLVLLRLVEKLKVTILGTSPKYLSELRSARIKPRDIFDLSSLKTVTVTGSNFGEDIAEWFYDEGFPPHVHANSTCGGTDISCSLITGNPTVPLHPGEIQVLSLGMATDIANPGHDSFKSLMHTPKPGELVCTKPWSSQPVMFWGKDGAEKYHNSYFERFGDSVWCQADFVKRAPDTGGFYMLGRSDGVLNPSGVRFGSAEIYEVVEKLPEIEESICVGQKRDGDPDESVILFVKMKPGNDLTPRYEQVIRSAIRAARSPRHVPTFIFEVPEIPYTINGKKIEIAVKQIVSGNRIKPSGSIANPDCLKFYERFHDIERMVAETKGRASL